MLKLNENEWKLVLWAYAYEIDCDPVISDFCFDHVSEIVNRQSQINIPGFDKSTGMWVHDLARQHPQIRTYVANMRKQGEGVAIIHVIPLEYIRPFDEKDIQKLR